MTMWQTRRKERQHSEATLLDEWLSQGARDRFTHGGPSLSRYFEAKKFVFDEKASAFVGDLLKRAPMEVLQEHEFARTPYPVTWVEIDHEAYYQALLPDVPLTPGHDTKIGFLFDHDRVYQYSASEKQSGVTMVPIVTHLHQPSSFEHELEQAQMCGLSRLTYRTALLGSINVSNPEQWWSEQATDIVRAHRVVCDKRLVDPVYDTMRVWQSLLLGGAGSLKLAIAIALLLTRPGSKILNVSEVGHRKAIFKGRNVVYKAHNKVTIRLMRRDPVVRFTAALATGYHRRRHGVRGHWAQTRRLATRGCSHNWDAITKDKYECMTCGAKRWWRKDHMRGDAERGFVTKQYDVTK